MSGRVFSNHVRWCVYNPCATNTDKIKKSVIESYNKRYGEAIDHIRICPQCGNEFTVHCRNHELTKSSKVPRYCSRRCANTRIHSDVTRQKISNALAIQFPVYKMCIGCSENFLVRNAIENRRKYCSSNCRKMIRQCNMSELNKYKRECQFNFALNAYPDEFDFDMIRDYGWYKAKNRGNNLNGVSRDHMIPIMYGWIHKISSDIISHPANCKLMRHNDNVSKGITPSITLEGLLTRIDTWNKKYG
jgi:hypothetical protein